MVNKRGRQKKFFSTLPTFIKHNQDKKLLEISRISLKESIRQMLGYPDLDAGLNTSRFLKVIAFPKPMRHSTLNNRDNGNGNNNSDCFNNDPRAANIYVSNCSCYCPSTAVFLV